MKHCLFSLLVLFLSLSGCRALVIDSGSGATDDTQNTVDASATDGATGSTDTASIDSGEAEDAPSPSDAPTVGDAVAVEDAGQEDIEGEDVPKPLPDAGEPSDVPEVIAGCTEDEQNAVQSVNPGPLMEKCEAQCGVGKTGCIVECFANATEVSLDCGACFGKTYDCIQDSCADVCDSLTDPECEKCASDKGCFAVLAECVGSDGPPAPGGLCSPIDIDQIENAGDKVDTAMAQCLIDCGQGDYTCIEQCMVNKVNISGSCSTCFGMYAACAQFECGDSCTDFAGGECQACMEKKGCKAQLQICLDGGPGGGPGGPPTPPEDAACGADDLMVMGALGEKMKDIISKCWDECANDDGPNCIGKCLQTATDLSAECSKCQGATYQCVYDTCLKECQNDLDAPECDGCVKDSGCLDTACFGGP